MFEECNKLITIPLFDTSNVTTMSWSFAYCSNLKYIPPLDTSNVTDMYAMFEDCSSLTSIPFLDTSNVTNMKYMFKECCLLTKKEQIKFFYQKDKLLLKSLELNPELFSEDKLDKLILKKYIPKESGLK
jgi:surface protein